MAMSESEPVRLVGNSTLGANVYALLVKRLNIYKRDRTGLCCEIVVPFFLVLLGCLLSLIDLTPTTTPIHLVASAYESPQQLLFNSAAVVDSSSTITPKTLATCLPSDSTEFAVTYSDSATFSSFYNDVNEARNIGVSPPYHYGSYQVYEADSETQQYSINAFVNLTSTDVMAYFPQFMYSSILQAANEEKGVKNFGFDTTIVPFPTLNTIE